MRAASSWDALDLLDDGATKHASSARVDLGGIAKGYAIDEAVAAMRRAGARGGLVDVGGDVRVFGRQPSQSPWEIQLRDPSGTGVVGTLQVRDSAVCTSGDYFRFAKIAGQRYSHIIDPRTGHPAGGVRSATVVAPNALTADAWATALSVLGEAGLDRVPPDLEAVLIVGSKGQLRAVATTGFRRLVRDDLPYPTTFR
jgi:thiamine biosynthesis lipoprotein